MKKLKTLFIVGLSLVFMAFGGAMAGDHPTGDHPAGDHPTGTHPAGSHDHPVGDHPKSPESHPTPQEMDHSTHGEDMGDMDHSDHAGENIRSVTIDGFKIAYHLIDMQEKIKAMKAAGHDHEMNMTHHMMVYISDSSGNPVTSAKVGFLVKSPDGDSQKLMCMGMGGGYGADVNFAASGNYTVKSKMVVGDNKIIDKFMYKMP